MSTNAKLRYSKEAELQSQLPLYLSNGIAITLINGCCPLCNNLVPPKKLKGKVNLALPSVIIFDAHGVCDQCKCIFPLNGRIRVKGKSMQLERLERGLWVIYSGQSGLKNLVIKFSEWLRNKISKLRIKIKKER